MTDSRRAGGIPARADGATAALQREGESDKGCAEAGLDALAHSLAHRRLLDDQDPWCARGPRLP
ncbi:hypothetical protein GCM10018777_57240 [Streptomyces albogriseolus]|nr:hypothetical protein GCM10018777_57240 [Streptomyces viridodiastaticus]